MKPLPACVNGDQRPICPPSKVLCRECLEALSKKMESMADPLAALVRKCEHVHDCCTRNCECDPAIHRGACLPCLRPYVEDLELEVADWRMAAEKVDKESCGGNQKHCTCVVLLRRRLAQVTGEKQTWVYDHGKLTMKLDQVTAALELAEGLLDDATLPEERQQIQDALTQEPNRLPSTEAATVEARTLVHAWIRKCTWPAGWKPVLDAEEDLIGRITTAFTRRTREAVAGEREALERVIKVCGRPGMKDPFDDGWRWYYRCQDALRATPPAGT